MLYRVAQLDDAAKLAALSVEVWLHTYAEDGISHIFANYVLQQFSIAHFQAGIADHSKQIILCEKAQKLLGYIAIDYQAENPACLCRLTDTAEITTLYVRPHHARQGIGSQLMQQAQQAALTHNVRSIWLSVLHKNQPALHFYRQQGFQQRGSIWFELSGERHENYVMMLDI